MFAEKITDKHQIQSFLFLPQNEQVTCAYYYDFFTKTYRLGHYALASWWLLKPIISVRISIDFSYVLPVWSARILVQIPDAFESIKFREISISARLSCIPSRWLVNHTRACLSAENACLLRASSNTCFPWRQAIPVQIVATFRTMYCMVHRFLIQQSTDPPWDY